MLQSPHHPRSPCSDGAGVALQPVENHAGADIHTSASGGSHTRANGYALKETEVHGGSTLEHTPDSHCGPWRGAHTGAREKCVEEGAAERSCYGLTTALMHHNPCIHSVLNWQ